MHNKIIINNCKTKSQSLMNFLKKEVIKCFLSVVSIKIILVVISIAQVYNLIYNKFNDFAGITCNHIKSIANAEIVRRTDTSIYAKCIKGYKFHYYHYSSRNKKVQVFYSCHTRIYRQQECIC